MDWCFNNKCGFVLFSISVFSVYYVPKQCDMDKAQHCELVEGIRVIDFSLCTNTVVPDTEWRGVGRTCTCNLTQTLWTLNWSSSLFLLSLICQHFTSSVASVCRLLRLCSYFFLFVFFFCSSSIYFPPLSPLIIFGRNSGFIIQPHLCQEGSHTAVEPSTLGS